MSRVLSGSAAYTGTVKREAIAARPDLPRVTFGRALLVLIAAVATVESLLVFRVWAQLSGAPLDFPLAQLLYDMSSWLVHPFKGLETTSPVQPETVLELATILALEAYLLLGAAVLVLLLALRGLVSLFTHDRTEPVGGEQPAAHLPRAA